MKNTLQLAAVALLAVIAFCLVYSNVHQHQLEAAQRHADTCAALVDRATHDLMSDAARAQLNNELHTTCPAVWEELKRREEGQ